MGNRWLDYFLHVSRFRETLLDGEGASKTEECFEQAWAGFFGESAFSQKASHLEFPRGEVTIAIGLCLLGRGKRRGLGGFA